MSKFGFHKWHNEDCNLELKSENGRSRDYFCHTHRQWATEYPVTTVVTYEDGTVYSLDRRLSNSRRLTKGPLKDD